MSEWLLTLFLIWSVPDESLSICVYEMAGRSYTHRVAGDCPVSVVVDLRTMRIVR